MTRPTLSDRERAIDRAVRAGFRSIWQEHCLSAMRAITGPETIFGGEVTAVHNAWREMHKPRDSKGRFLPTTSSRISQTTERLRKELGK